jgi:hypothetical protein
MTLYHSAGGSFELTAGEWSDFLALARRHGWRPAGSASPAIHFDLDAPPVTSARWDGRYEHPEGQIVSDRDSRCFADALRKAARTMPTLKRTRIENACAFCETGGFLVSNTPPPETPATQPPPHSAQLLSLQRHLESQAPAPLSRQTSAASRAKATHR